MHFLYRCTQWTGSQTHWFHRIWCAALFILTCCAVQISSAQNLPNTAGAAPQFDVAAIHPHNPEPHERSHIISQNGRFTTINVDLKSILQWAYDLPESRIIGGPSWLGTARWDIEAKSDTALDAQKDYDHTAAWEQKRQMVQSLLAGRFHLIVHKETRELPIYNLVVAKGGAKFLDTKAEGSKFDRWNGRIELQGGDNTVSVLAEQLAEVLGRVVVDKTGITGRYRIALSWTPDDRAAPPSGAPPADSGPSIFTALEEQLGLKLESAKGPVEVLVIDSVAQPSEN
ncbi:MAG TPA: TIGR03435 family protein [Terracidiphilus sp.]|nr:TIGR03435 family protein [Terracidiphilus sp.]